MSSPLNERDDRIRRKILNKALLMSVKLRMVLCLIALVNHGHENALDVSVPRDKKTRLCMITMWMASLITTSFT